MPRYMLDTDTCSFIIKRTNEKITRRLRRISIDDLCISVMTKAELLYGVDISPRQRMDEAAVTAFLQHVTVLDFPDSAAHDYAAIRGHLKCKGTMVGANDLFVAAHARRLGLTLVTSNLDEFRRVPHLKIESWA